MSNRTVVVSCPICGKSTELVVSASGFYDWQSGELIQNALPELDEDQREQLISGTCPKCWDAMFPDEDE